MPEFMEEHDRYVEGLLPHDLAIELAQAAARLVDYFHEQDVILDRE